TLLRDRVGRPTRLHAAPRFAATVGVPGLKVFLKRVDMANPGSQKITSAGGLALLALRLGKTRIVAETGAGQHGGAVAAVCAMLGLECVIYMGGEYMRRQPATVARMRMLGADVRPVETGNRRVKEAISASVRDWVANLADTHLLLGTVVGPAPYPQMVRDFQTVIGREARADILWAEGRLPDLVLACVGGGSNALGLFHPFAADPQVELVAVEAAGRGRADGDHAATLTAGSPGEIDGTFSYLLQDADGQIVHTHSIAAGLDYPGVGPELSYLRDSGRVSAQTATDAVALRGMRALSRTEGLLAGLESAHAVGHLIERAERGELTRNTLVVLCLSGSGDKDLGLAAERLDP
uniref:tryptophan synthase subunit beta n=1 Tax=Nocardia cyriacigeorgica TaxID=135487 RepID=UPI0024579990